MKSIPFVPDISGFLKRKLSMIFVTFTLLGLALMAGLSLSATDHSFAIFSVSLLTCCAGLGFFLAYDPKDVFWIFGGALVLVLVVIAVAATILP